MAGRMINGAAALAELIRPASDTDEAGVHRVLPVPPELSGLLPNRGLRRGSTVAVATGQSAPGSGGTSLLLALLSAASRAGSWCAVVGVPELGALAAAESGIALDRLALVPNPGPEWPTVVAALIDGVDVVVAAVPGPISASIASRLVARARQRGSVLMPFGRWDGADVTLQVMHGMWDGLGAGRGRLRRREVTITARGRGAAARPREITLWMPGLITPPPIKPPPTAALPTDDHPAGPSADFPGAVPAGAGSTGAVSARAVSLRTVSAGAVSAGAGASPDGVAHTGGGRSAAAVRTLPEAGDARITAPAVSAGSEGGASVTVIGTREGPRREGDGDAAAGGRGAPSAAGQPAQSQPAQSQPAQSQPAQSQPAQSQSARGSRRRRTILSAVV
jgi:hypothetical protein